MFSTSFNVDPAIMEHVDEVLSMDTSIVNLIVSPGIRRYGNQEDYDKTEVVVKLKVLCDAEELVHDIADASSTEDEYEYSYGTDHLGSDNNWRRDIIHSYFW